MPYDRIVGGCAVRAGTTRKGDYIATYNGNEFWPLDPRAIEVDSQDIAHALAHICRFNGHTRRFYSVAQHSIIVSHLVPKEYALWGLLHDASEAYLSDLARPVKKNMPQYREIEDGLLRTIAERFWLEWPIPPIVLEVDMHIVADEAVALFKDFPEWTRAYKSYGVKPSREWCHWWTKRAFLRRFNQLTAVQNKRRR